MIETAGALVVGRKLFDITNGWGGRHPIDVPVFVVTHNPPTDWKPREPTRRSRSSPRASRPRSRKARELAGEKAVVVNGGQMARQALEAGLIDEIWIDLVPVLLGGGTPFFDQLKTARSTLEGPISIVEGKAVTHLRYRVVQRLQSDRASSASACASGEPGGAV